MWSINSFKLLWSSHEKYKREWKQKHNISFVMSSTCLLIEFNTYIFLLQKAKHFTTNLLFYRHHRSKLFKWNHYFLVTKKEALQESSLLWFCKDKCFVWRIMIILCNTLRVIKKLCAKFKRMFFQCVFLIVLLCTSTAR